MPALKPPTLADHAVLALLAERPSHGWAIVRELAPDGELGRVWTLSRPLAYRAMDNLEIRGLAHATGTEPGQGPRRTIFAPTAAGRREVEYWLASPVKHLRDVRTELLLKLMFHHRSGSDPRPLLREQERTLQPISAALGDAASRPDADLVDLWRHESAQSVRRFLTDAKRARPHQS